MSISLHLTHGARTEQFALSVLDLTELTARATGSVATAMDLLMRSRSDGDDLGEPRTVGAATLRRAVADILNGLDPPGTGGYAYSFLVTFPGARAFEVEGLAKLRVGGENCDIDAGFERCELRTVRLD